MRNCIGHQLSFSRALLIAVATIMALPPISTASQGDLSRGAIPPSTQGYRLGEIRLTGAKRLDTDTVRSALGLVSGEIYDESQLRKNIENLKKAYGTLGFITFQVQPVFNVDEQRKILNVTVNIDEGLPYYFNRITFTGNTTIPDEVLRREIALKEGLLFDSTRLEFSRLRLNQLGLFEEIKVEDFQITPSPDTQKVDIVLKVKEKQR
jgi:outer membrane protein insertion porin family